MSLKRWLRDRWIRNWITDGLKGKEGAEVMGVLLWLRSHKKVVAGVVAAVSAGAQSAGYPEAGHVLELIAAALFGGGLRSDAGVKEDHGL